MGQSTEYNSHLVHLALASGTTGTSGSQDYNNLCPLNEKLPLNCLAFQLQACRLLVINALKMWCKSLNVLSGTNHSQLFLTGGGSTLRETVHFLFLMSNIQDIDSYFPEIYYFLYLNTCDA